MKSAWHKEIRESMREIVFGLEDSLVSTLGALTGIAAGTRNASVVILSGLVIVAVEAVSMAAGSYLSSKIAAEAEQADGIRTSFHAVRAAGVMGVFYVMGGMVPLAAYLIFPIETASLPSVIITAVVLFGVGAWSASFAKRSLWKGGVEMLVVSLAAAGIGYMIGCFAQQALGVRL